MNLYFIEVLFIIVYFFIRLYTLTNKIFILSYNNGKLNEYIKNEDLENTTCNLENTKNNIVYSKILSELVSPIKYKQVSIILLITFLILILNLSSKYNIIFSNFFYINIFNKNIDIVSLFSQKYVIVRNTYLVIYCICIYDMVYNLSNSKLIYDAYLLLNKNKIMQKNKIVEDKIKNDEVVLGKNKNKLVYIKKEGLYQNVLITGSIGSGKTSGAISNILDGLIKNKLSGLVIDVKGNYVDTVELIAKKYNRQKDVLKFTLDNEIKYNPLNNNINDIEMSSMLRKVLELLSKTNNSDSFWLDKVENYLRDFICLIKAYKEYVDFYEIHKLVTDDKYLRGKLELVKENILKNKLSDEELFKIRSSINNIKYEYINLDDRTLSIIKAEITRITAIFVSDCIICDKFCSRSDTLDYFNKIVVVSINIGKNNALSKIISTYIKLNFQREVLSRNLNSNGVLKSIFFVCDEFQEVCNSEDAKFFSVAREYKCINVISMQSYTSLSSCLNDDKSAKVIIQNLVNKIWFRNDDSFTINETINQVGKELKCYKIENISENGQNTRYNFFSNSFVDYKSGISKGYTYSQVLDNKLNPEYFTTKLNTYEAVCLLSNGNTVEYVDKIKFKRWEC